jgi:hypothetical protein
MSIRLEYQARRALRGLSARIGTPEVSRALLALAGVYLLVASLWARSGGRDASAALVGSFAFDVLAVALLVDAAVSILRAIPIRPAASGGYALSQPSVEEWGGLLLRAAYLLLAAAFAASLLARDVLTLRIAEGEEVTLGADQFVERAPPRPYSSGPFPVAFDVERVEGSLRPDGTTSGLSVLIRGRDGSWETLRGWRPRWSGWGRLLYPSRSGYALRYSIAVDRGAVLDTAFAKVDLLPPGRSQEVRSVAVPHRMVFSVQRDATTDPAHPALQATVFRNRLAVGEGRLDGGRTVHFDGLTLAVPELRRWVELTMVRDPGLGIAGVAILFGVAGLAARQGGRRGRRRGELSQPDPAG